MEFKSESRLKKNFSLGPLTTLGVGGPADYFAEIHTEEELASFYLFCREKNLPVTVLGFGSNVVVSDKGVRGAVVRLAGDFLKLEKRGEEICAGAAVRLPKLVTFAAELGFKGMESLVGVPGTVGGGVYMNAGTKEGEIAQHLARVRIFDPSGLNFNGLVKDRIKFSYRKSSFQEISAVVLFVFFKFPLAESKEEVLNRISELMRRRRETQPVDTKNAGSMFRNPEGDYAARLIEAAGMKGKRVGKAQISELHANFISNLGGATAGDVRALMRQAQEAVREKFKVELEPEVRFVGDFS